MQKRSMALAAGLLMLGSTPLCAFTTADTFHSATSLGDEADVVDGIRAGYINSTTDKGMTGLHYAAANEHLAIVEKLLAAGAHVNRLSGTPAQRRLAKDYVIKTGAASPTVGKIVTTPLDLAPTKRVQILLQKNGARTAKSILEARYLG